MVSTRRGTRYIVVWCMVVSIYCIPVPCMATIILNLRVVEGTFTPFDVTNVVIFGLTEAQNRSIWIGWRAVSADPCSFGVFLGAKRVASGCGTEWFLENFDVNLQADVAHGPFDIFQLATDCGDDPQRLEVHMPDVSGDGCEIHMCIATTANEVFACIGPGFEGFNAFDSGNLATITSIMQNVIDESIENIESDVDEMRISLTTEIEPRIDTMAARTNDIALFSFNTQNSVDSIDERAQDDIDANRSVTLSKDFDQGDSFATIEGDHGTGLLPPEIPTPTQLELDDYGSAVTTEFVIPVSLLQDLALSAGANPSPPFQDVVISRTGIIATVADVVGLILLAFAGLAGLTHIVERMVS